MEGSFKSDARADRDDAVGPAVPALSVVVPAYNEDARIERSLMRTLDFLAEREGGFEIIVVDDGSRDATAIVVSSLAARDPRVQLVRLPQNRGKGAAIRAGVAASRGELVLMMDADLATPIEELHALERALTGGAVVATASRALGSSDVRRAQSPLRVLLGRLGNLWIRALAVPGIHDTQCGFKLFRGEVARELFAMCREDRFGIDIEVLHLASRLGHRIAEVGVRWEHQEGSKVRPRDYVDVLLKVPRIAWGARKIARRG
jgi:glycosyltransferase involved in cell wall biosynthesis